MHANAHMDPCTKTQMPARITPPGIEARGSRKNCLVPVGRCVQHHHPCARRNLDTADIYLPGCVPAEGTDGRPDTDRLLNRIGDQRTVLLQFLPLFRIRREMVDQVADGGNRRVQAGIDVIPDRVWCDFGVNCAAFCTLSDRW